MKHLVVTVLMFFSVGTLCALPVGNPGEASLFLSGVCHSKTCCDPYSPSFNWCNTWRFRLGFYGDYVFNRHMEIYFHDGDDDSGPNLETTKIFTNAAYIALSIYDLVDVFATFGASTFHIKADDKVWNPELVMSQSELAFEPFFSWSIGARATLWQRRCFLVGIEGQYFRTQPRFDYFLSYDNGSFTYLNDSRRSIYQEWQIALGLAYRVVTRCPIFAMVPYAAVKLAGAKFYMHDVTFLNAPFRYTLSDLKSQQFWGYAIGCTFTFSETAGITVEGRWADEKALYANGQVRF